MRNTPKYRSNSIEILCGAKANPILCSPFLFPTTKPMLHIMIFSIYFALLEHGRLAQLVEQLIYTEKVGGSSPSSPTQKTRFGGFLSGRWAKHFRALRRDLKKLSRISLRNYHTT